MRKHLIFILLLGICTVFIGTRYYLSDNISMNGESMMTDINQYNSRATDFPVKSMITDINQNKSRVTDILVRTWKGDGHWLIFLLRSIEKFVSRDSYRNIIITYDKSDAHFFNSYLTKFEITLPIKTIASMDSKGWKHGINNGGYHAQIYSKLIAHTYSDADYFVHIDSDCIFNTYVNSSHFFDSNGRVYLKPAPYSDLAPNFHIWKNVSQNILMMPVEFETMTKMPLVYPSVLYPAVLNHISKVHKNQNVLSVLQQMPTITEFPVLGAYLMKFMPELWTPLPEDIGYFVTQSWSWGGFGPENVAYYECILRSQKREDCFFASLAPTPSPNKLGKLFFN